MRKVIILVSIVLATTTAWGSTLQSTSCTPGDAGSLSGGNTVQGFCIDTYDDGFGIRDYGPSLGGTPEQRSRPRAAEAIFRDAGSGMLLITLKNILPRSDFDQYPDNQLVPVDILTGLFFDVVGASVTLMPVSATISVGSVIYENDVLNPDGHSSDVSGEWAYATSASGFPPMSPAPDNFMPNYGISSSGVGAFGPPDRFCILAGTSCTNLDGPANGSLGGIEYGLLPVGYKDLSPEFYPRNGGLDGRELVYYAVDFKLNGWTGGDPLGQIGNIFFQYGTGFSEPYLWPPCTPGDNQACSTTTVPEPATLGLLLGGLGMLLLRQSRRRKALCGK